MEKIEKKFSNAKERFKYFLELQGKSKNNFTKFLACLMGC